MATDTPIQWCDDAVNPVMGCQGCELWLTGLQIKKALEEKILEKNPKADRKEIQLLLQEWKDGTDIHKARKKIVENIVAKLSVDVSGLETVIDESLRCYAGRQHLTRGPVNRGYAPKFEQVTAYRGRVMEMAQKPTLTGYCRPNKPWLNDFPRMIFISDMADALSKGITNEFLKEEIIDPVSRTDGQRHVWLWLTKLPHRMVDFNGWLKKQNLSWPKNLVAMTSVTSSDSTNKNRLENLKKLNGVTKGLSVEPLWQKVDLDLEGIHWCIVGGESGKESNPKPFHLEWAEEIKKQCEKTSTSFFLKQIGAAPFKGGKAYKIQKNGKDQNLKDSHGGEWSEWPEEFNNEQSRQIPEIFKRLVTNQDHQRLGLGFRDKPKKITVEDVVSDEPDVSKITDDNLEEQIKNAHLAAIAGVTAAVRAAYTAGKLLLEVQTRKRRAFTPWLKTISKTLSSATAYRYMKLANSFSLLRDFDELSLTQAYVITGALKPEAKSELKRPSAGRDQLSGLAKHVELFRRSWTDTEIATWSDEKRELFLQEYKEMEAQVEEVRRLKEQMDATASMLAVKQTEISNTDSRSEEATDEAASGLKAEKQKEKSPKIVEQVKDPRPKNPEAKVSTKTGSQKSTGQKEKTKSKGKPKPKPTT